MNTNNTKMPAFQFYPADWLSDIAVNALTYEQQGIWFRLICLMHESSQRGKLILNGKAMCDEDIARVLGLNNQIGSSVIATLLNKGVASRCEETGALMNRRMVRDEDQRRDQRDHGKLGGNPKLCAGYNKPGFLYAAQRSSDGAVKIGISEQPAKRLYKLRYQQKQPVEMLGFMHVEDMGKAEAAMHQKYNHCASGEWFALTDSERSTLVFTLKGAVKGYTGGGVKGAVKGDATPSARKMKIEDSESDPELRVPGQSSESWFAFRTHAESCGISGSEPDWESALVEFDRLPITERLSAQKGLTVRKGSEDPALRSLPQNYLRKKMWQRTVTPRKAASAGSQPLGPYRPASWNGEYPEAASGFLLRRNGNGNAN